MEKNQIVRIPIKYGELINTMTNEECGKLFKAIMNGSNENIDGLTLTYYNIINVDIVNLYNASNNGKKGGRPKKEEIKKPGVSEIKNQGLGNIETNIKKDKEKQDKEKKIIYGEEKKVKLTLTEYNKLVDKIGAKFTEDYIEKLELYILQKGKDSYKSHYAVILNWSKKDGVQKPTSGVNFL